MGLSDHFFLAPLLPLHPNGGEGHAQPARRRQKRNPGVGNARGKRGEQLLRTRRNCTGRRIQKVGSTDGCPNTTAELGVDRSRLRGDYAIDVVGNARYQAGHLFRNAYVDVLDLHGSVSGNLHVIRPYRLGDGPTSRDERRLIGIVKQVFKDDQLLSREVPRRLRRDACKRIASRSSIAVASIRT